MVGPSENELSKTVLDAALAVHKALGPGLLESAYEGCLAIELEERGLPFHRQKVLPVTYKTHQIESGYRLDLLVAEKLVVEIKSVDRLTDVHRAQILSYLRLGDFRLGLLINFNVARLRDGVQRFANGLEER
ncbi:MAG: GxxExxY protein [Marivibrio sp.]|uniref:GxxExxY protein n=1 Tax=Marivibrio sp. TaxID=2039719 RepID=UPI0032EE7BDD